MRKLLGLGVALLVACGHSGGGAPAASPDAIKAEWTPKVKAKLDKIVAAAAAAQGGELGAPGDAKLALDFAYDAKDHPNVIAVQLEDAQLAPRPTAADASAAQYQAAAEGKPIEMGPPRPHFTFQNDFDNHVLEGKQLLGIEASRIGKAWEYAQLVDAKYLLVITPGAVQWPTKAGATFQTGAVQFRAMLVDIDTAKPLGGFDGTAENSDQVRVEGDTDEHDTKKLENDFLAAYSKAIAGGITTRWPDAKLPVLLWGYGS